MAKCDYKCAALLAARIGAYGAETNLGGGSEMFSTYVESNRMATRRKIATKRTQKGAARARQVSRRLDICILVLSIGIGYHYPPFAQVRDTLSG